MLTLYEDYKMKRHLRMNKNFKKKNEDNKMQERLIQEMKQK